MSLLAIISGSYLKHLPGFEHVESVPEETPFGQVRLYRGMYMGKPLVFVNRHADPQFNDGMHRLNPTRVNYRAIVWALKKAGVTQALNICAGGSYKEEIPPGYFGLADDFVDLTKKRQDTFFDDGVVVHPSFHKATCPAMDGNLVEVGQELMGKAFHVGGTAVVIEGPRFATTAESWDRRKAGHSYSTMTPMPMAILLREAEICASFIVVVTDFDAWRTKERASVAQVMKVIAENEGKVLEFVRGVIPRLVSREERHCLCATALTGAIQTPAEQVSKVTRSRFAVLLGRVLPASKSEDKE